MNSRLEAQSRQLSQNSNLTSSNSTQVQETASNAEVLPCAEGDHFFLRLAAGATPRTGPRVRATRPRSLQALHTWWTRRYRPLSSSSSTKSSVLPNFESSSSSWERPSWRIGIAKRNCGGRFSSADVLHSSSAIEKNDCSSPTFKT